MPRRRTTIIATSITVVVLAALGVGGYVIADKLNTSFRIAGDQPAAAAVKTPVPTPVDPEEAAKVAADKASKGLTVGAVLTADQAKAISGYWQGSLLAYKMADSSQVLIARDQPLPENAKADAGKKLSAAAQAAASSGDAINGAVLAAQKSAAYELGHRVVTIVYLRTHIDGGPLGWTWMNGTDGVQYSSSAAAIAGLGPIPAGTEVIISQ